MNDENNKNYIDDIQLDKILLNDEEKRKLQKDELINNIEECDDQQLNKNIQKSDVSLNTPTVKTIKNDNKVNFNDENPKIDDDILLKDLENKIKNKENINTSTQEQSRMEYFKKVNIPLKNNKDKDKDKDKNKNKNKDKNKNKNKKPIIKKENTENTVNIKPTNQQLNPKNNINTKLLNENLDKKIYIKKNDILLQNKNIKNNTKKHKINFFVIILIIFISFIFIFFTYKYIKNNNKYIIPQKNIEMLNEEYDFISNNSSILISLNNSLKNENDKILLYVDNKIDKKSFLTDITNIKNNQIILQKQYNKFNPKYTEVINSKKISDIIFNNAILLSNDLINDINLKNNKQNLINDYNKYINNINSQIYLYNQYITSVFQNNGISIKFNNDNTFNINVLWLDKNKK